MIEQLDFLTFLVLAAIILAAVTGLIALLRSISHMKQEVASLNSFKTELKSASIEATVDKWTNSLPPEKKPNHLEQRLLTMKQSLDNDLTRDKELPELHDLHELTLQNEMGSASSATMRTVISFLLILGILGTLSGVHGVVGSNPEDLTGAMAAALLPSMVAVGSTVILMFIRGRYTALVDEYLEHLDLLTMTKLIPGLQPVSDSKVIGDQLQDDIKKFNDDAAKIKGATKTLNESANQLKEEIEGFAEVMEEVSKTLKTIQEVEQAQSGDGGAGNRAAIHTQFQTLNRKLGEMEKINTDLEGCISLLKESSTATIASLTELRGNMENAEKRVEDSMEMVCQIADSASRFHNYTALISEYGNNLQDLLNTHDNMRGAYETVLANKDQVEQYITTAAHVADEVEQSRSALEEAKNQLLEYAGNDFQAQTASQKVSTQAAALGTEIARLDDSSKKLMRAFEERARQAGIKR